MGLYRMSTRGSLAAVLAAAAPYLILRVVMSRPPTPRIFAYALVIPAIRIFFGLFGSASIVIFAARSYPGLSIFSVLFSILSWFLDIGIFYLAMQAVNRTGIHPKPIRLILAALVIFIYTSLIPAVALLSFPR